QFFDLFCRRRPRAHEPVNVRLDELIELPALPPHPLDDLAAQMDKERVCLARKGKSGLTCGAQTFLQELRHFVGVPGITQPDAIGQNSGPLRSQKTRLGRQWPALLDAELELAGQVATKENRQFAGSESVFCAAKGEDIYPTLPAHFLWLAAE